MTILLVASADSLLRVRSTSGGWTAEQRLEGRRVQCIAFDPSRAGRAYAGLHEGGVVRTDDGGDTWAPAGVGLARPHVLALAVSPLERGGRDDAVVYAGTEPSAVFRSEDGGATWLERTGLTELPSASHWSFPPRPDTHHVRWITPDPLEAGRLYVCIEAGALVRSPDGGSTWWDRVSGGPRDTHALAIHAAAPGLLVSAAGDGYAESADGGETWSRPREGIEHHYLWGVALDAVDPALRIVSAAAGPRPAHDGASAESYVYRREGTAAWERSFEGLPDAHGATVASLAAHPHERGVFFAASNRGLHQSRDGGRSWTRLPVSLPDRSARQRINGLAAAEL